MRTVCPICQRARFCGEPLRDFRVALRALGYMRGLRLAHTSCVLAAIKCSKTRARKRSDMKMQLEPRNLI